MYVLFFSNTGSSHISMYTCMLRLTQALVCHLRFPHIVWHLKLKGVILPSSHEQLADEDEDEHDSEASKSPVENVVPFPIPWVLHYTTDTLLISLTEHFHSCGWNSRCRCRWLLCRWWFCGWCFCCWWFCCWWFRCWWFCCWCLSRWVLCCWVLCCWCCIF